MRVLLVCLAFLLGSFASAEVQLQDISAIQEFSDEYAQIDVRGIADAAIQGEIDAEDFLLQMKSAALEPAKEVLSIVSGMLAPLLLAVIAGCILKNCGAVAFLVRMYLLSGMCRLGMLSLEAASDCLSAAGKFADIAAPILAALLSTAGLNASAAMLSPAAALAGGIAGDVFRTLGLPLCTLALCMAIAGNLGASLDLSGMTKLLRRIVGWGTGLCFTFFTALIALQGNVSACSDGIALRTAKYAVDSAAPVIGSGVSDAWEAYVSGMMAAKSAVGVSGIAVLLAAAAKPMISAGCAMFALHIISAIMDVFGEKCSARAASQVGNVCQMALELCTGMLAITTILLGAAMAAGRGLIV